MMVYEGLHLRSFVREGEISSSSLFDQIYFVSWTDHLFALRIGARTGLGPGLNISVMILVKTYVCLRKSFSITDLILCEHFHVIYKLSVFIHQSSLLELILSSNATNRLFFFMTLVNGRKLLASHNNFLWLFRIQVSERDWIPFHIRSELNSVAELGSQIELLEDERQHAVQFFPQLLDFVLSVSVVHVD